MLNPKRLALATAATLMALPASALAANTNSGVVLTAHGHAVQVVDAAHQVSAYNFTGSAPKLHTGSRITFAQEGNAISGLRVTGSTSRITYDANVVHISGDHLVLRLSDGKSVSFGPHQVSQAHSGRAHKEHSAFDRAGATLTVNIQLQAGTPVLVDESVARNGDTTVSLTIQAADGSGSGSGDGSGSGGGSGGTTAPKGDKTAGGTVTDIENASFGIVTASGSQMSFQMGATDLSNVGMNPCDTVTVSYHQSGGSLVADSVNDTGSSDAGQCDNDSTYYATQDETGPITAISDTSITIDTSDNGSMTFPLDPGLTLNQGFLVGDVVDVTYSPVPGGVNFVSDIEYVENDSTGTVTAVSANSMTITDDSTGQPDVFSDPTGQQFSGVNVGDDVDVTWHQAAGGVEIADDVSDLS